METPQATRKDWLEKGLQMAEKQGITITDELAAIELSKRKVAFLNPGYPNPKITMERDLAYIKYLLENE
jgi:2-C-methyl-D-erythritol 4-phosphate cytidylyltransferase